MDPKEQEETDKVNLVHSLKKRVRIEYSRICRQRRQKKAELAKVRFLFFTFQQTGKKAFVIK